MTELLRQSFFARDALVVARDLIGCVLVHGEVALRITETEAYRHPHDTASHCRPGFTARTAPMWGPPGHVYVYLCYGIHSLLNLVTDDEGEGAAVLIRSAELERGAEIVHARRGVRSADEVALLAGPGKVCAALALDPGFSGRSVFVPGGLEVHGGEPVREVLVGPRVGVDYAAPLDRDAPYRFADAGSRVVTRRRTLRPLVRFPR
ncbi:MAG: DNA-3-methyladenine glycosylase [Sandaracinaceae bacterium]|nr:DNA-3-methyladenine glycosylase [Sandaracinaceae bacterium]